MSEIELDPELLSDFIVESKELLDDYISNTIELESKPEDPDAIGAIFRAAHTLKGSSAFFNLIHIKNFAHKLENLLDEIRNKRLAVDPEIIYIILNGGNHLKAMFERVSDGDGRIEHTPDEEAFLQDILRFLEAAPQATPEELLRTIKGLTLDFKKTGQNPEELLQKIDALLADYAQSEAAAVSKGQMAPAGASRSYRLGEVGIEPLGRAVSLMEEAVAGEAIDAEAYDQALEDLEALVEAENLEPLAQPLAAAVEDFRAIKNSDLDFDGLLIGMMKERLEAVVALVKVTEAAAAPASAEAPRSYRLGEVGIEPLGRAVSLMEEAVAGEAIDAEAYDQALEDLEALVEAENLEPLAQPLAAAVEDFRAIKNSDLDFDGLLIGMMKERLEAVVALVKVTEAAAAPASAEAPRSYRLGDVEIEPLGRAVSLMEEAVAGEAIDAEAYDQALEDLEALIEAESLEPLAQPLAAAVEDFRAIKNSDLDFDGLLIGMMKERLDEVLSRVVVTIETPVEAQAQPEEAAGTPAETRPQAAKEDKRERKTMRIDEEKVDGFMNYVGELIVTAESFSYLQKMIEAERISPVTIRAFKNANQAFRELSSELQEGLMEIRRVPIKGLLQKVTLMARELAHQMDKAVKVEMAGQEVQVDKSIAESLEGPLVHVIRNSMDHGLETTADREETGKTPEGLLRVTASADKEFFYLEVYDDGRGISPDKMRAAAVKKEVMGEAQAAGLTDKEAINLIFGAGFSTAEQITDVSGRGVGMDVVRTNISQLNGSINVDSVVGQNTTISFKIPLSVTLQVVKALLVRVGSEDFIISLDDIVETLRVDPGDLSTIEGRGEVIIRRGSILPLIRLYEAFDIEPRFTDPTEAILVVINTERGIFGLLVDEVLGQQQVVVKDLGTQFRNLSCLAGSAILGDGRLGLVLDANGVVRLAQGLA